MLWLLLLLFTRGLTLYMEESDVFLTIFQDLITNKLNTNNVKVFNPCSITDKRILIACDL